MPSNVSGVSHNPQSKVFAMGERPYQNRAIAMSLGAVLTILTMASATSILGVTESVSSLSGKFQQGISVADDVPQASLTRTSVDPAFGQLKEAMTPTLGDTLKERAATVVQHLGKTSTALNDRIDDLGIQITSPDGWKKIKENRDSRERLNADAFNISVETYRQRRQNDENKKNEVARAPDKSKQISDVGTQWLAQLKTEGYLDTSVSVVHSSTPKTANIIANIMGSNYHVESNGGQINMVGYQIIGKNTDGTPHPVDSNEYTYAYTLLHEAGHASRAQLKHITHNGGADSMLDEAYGDAYASLALIKLSKNDMRVRTELSQWQRWRTEQKNKSLSSSVSSESQMDSHIAGGLVIDRVLKMDASRIIDMSPAELRFVAGDISRHALQDLAQSPDFQHATANHNEGMTSKDLLDYTQKDLASDEVIMPKKLNGSAILAYRARHIKEEHTINVPSTKFSP